MLHPSDSALVRQIERAFAGVTLGDGTSLNMTLFYDSWGSAPQFAERAKCDERRCWKSIPDATLERFTVTFCFTDLLGYRFYLPAYMQWTVKNHRRSTSIISDFTIYALDPSYHQFKEAAFVEWFTRGQIDAILAFLDFCAGNGDSVDANAAIRNRATVRLLLADRDGG